MSTAMRAANARKQADVLALLQLKASKLSTPRKCTTLACRAGLPAARNLAGTQRAQVLGYFCGPATVTEMLAQVGVRIGQAAAARQLGTDPSGTNWSDASGYPVPRVLNQNQKRNAYVAVALPWTPTAAQISTYETDLVTDVNHNGGVPLAGNADEVAGRTASNRNPINQTIMHWFDIRGYQKYGAITDYEDSVHGATSIGWAMTVPAYYGGRHIGGHSLGHAGRFDKGHNQISRTLVFAFGRIRRSGTRRADFQVTQEQRTGPRQ